MHTSAFRSVVVLGLTGAITFGGSVEAQQNQENVQWRNHLTAKGLTIPPFKAMVSSRPPKRPAEDLERLRNGRPKKIDIPRNGNEVIEDGADYKTKRGFNRIGEGGRLHLRRGRILVEDSNLLMNQGTIEIGEGTAERPNELVLRGSDISDGVIKVGRHARLALEGPGQVNLLSTRIEIEPEGELFLEGTAITLGATVNSQGEIINRGKITFESEGMIEGDESFTIRNFGTIKHHQRKGVKDEPDPTIEYESTGATLVNEGEDSKIIGPGFFHGSVVNFGTIEVGPPDTDLGSFAGPRASASPSLYQITGGLISQSSSVFNVTISGSQYGQFWSVNRVILGGGTMNVTEQFDWAQNSMFPVIKSSHSIIGSHFTSVKTGGVDNIYVRPTDISSICQDPSAVPNPTPTLAVSPPACYPIRKNVP